MAVNRSLPNSGESVQPVDRIDQMGVKAGSSNPPSPIGNFEVSV